LQLGRLAIDLALDAPEGVTFVARAFGGFNAAPTAPAKTLAGPETMHLFAGMMDSAAIAEKRICHGDLMANLKGG
jgi:hypothetical protein